MSPGYFRSLAFLYRARAEVLRAPEPLTPRQRELMARLFEELAANAEVCAECMDRLKSAALPEKDEAEVRRERIKKWARRRRIE